MKGDEATPETNYLTMMVKTFITDITVIKMTIVVGLSFVPAHHSTVFRIESTDVTLKLW